MSPSIYSYIFYGSLVIMPILLFLIFFVLDRCRVWSKKTAKDVAEIKEQFSYDDVNRLLSCISERLADFNDKIAPDFQKVLMCEIKQAVKECLKGNLEKDYKDIEFLEPIDDLQTQSENQELKPFNLNDYLARMSDVESKPIGFQDLDEAFQVAFDEGNVEEVREVSNDKVADYSDKYLKRPGICLNNIGIKRISIPPELWHTINSLAYANASGSQNIEPLSISAVAFNIINDHFNSHSEEINILAERGTEKILRGYDRY